MSTRLRVNAGGYRHADPVVGVSDGEGQLVITNGPEHDPDEGGVTVEGRCAHCKQRYVMHGMPEGGITFPCCGDHSYGALSCVRCARHVTLVPRDVP